MITKKQKFRTGVGCIYWLLVATWSFSLQLLQKSSGRWEPEEEESWKHPMAADWFFIFYLDFFIPFSFPSRARTGNAVPDYLPGIKEADGGGVAVVLLLLQLQQSSTSPLPFSRHLCWSYCASFLRTKRREREGGYDDDDNSSAFNFCATTMLRDRGEDFNSTAGSSCISMYLWPLVLKWNFLSWREEMRSLIGL